MLIAHQTHERRSRFRNWVSSAAPLLLLSLCLGAPAEGSTINLGLISFDVFIPAGAGPGVNAFNLSNFTGDPGGGGFALPPDFPVFTGVTFLNASLTLAHESVTDVVLLGDLLPGSYSPLNLLFPDTTLFTSATFSATIDSPSLLLSDGSTFQAGSLNLIATLIPSAPGPLSAGTDLLVITVSDEVVSNIPEPSTTLLIGAGLVVGALLKHRRRP